MHKFYINSTVLLGLGLMASCSQGVSDTGPAAVSAPTTDPATNVTPRVATLSIMLQAGNNAQLTWPASSPMPAYYDVWIKAANGYTNRVRLTGDQVGYLDTGLTNNMTYNYQVRAYNHQDVLLNTYQSSARINVYSAVSSDSVL